MTNDWSELGVTPNSDGEIETTCVSCGGPAVLWRGGEDELKAHCIKCKQLDPQLVVDALRAAFKARQSSPDSQPKPTSKVFASKPLAVTNGHSNGHSLARIEDDPVQKQLSADYAFSFLVREWADTAGFRELYPTNEEFNPKLVEQIHFWITHGKVRGYENFTEAEALAKAHEIAAYYAPLPQPVIIDEDYESALAANELYLSRQEIVERLFYAQSISLFVGGKHHGKSTAVRTLALSIAWGLPFLKRNTTAGHVIYGASAEEVPVARMELLNMGWQQNRDALSLVYANPDAPNQDDERDRVLEQIANLAIKRGTRFIILDMLFDFARIKDEMSYAGTREAIGKIQRLADITKAHVLATHHTPKYMLDTASAATAALGSQGIAARFSPILLSRSWGANIYTIESTMTRDPRGKEIEQMVVTKNDQGWIESQGEFKESMKWPLYEKRIIDLMEGADDEKKFTVIELSRTLEVARPHIQNAVKKMWELGRLKREKYGTGFRYWKENPGSTDPEER